MSEKDLREVFAFNLKQYMIDRGYEQVDLVNKLGYSFSTVSDWVHGKKYPRVDAMQKLAKTLNVSISDLTSDKEDIVLPAQQLNEDEEELIRIYRSLERRERHQLMSLVYDFQSRCNRRM